MLINLSTIYVAIIAATPILFSDLTEASQYIRGGEQRRTTSSRKKFEYGNSCSSKWKGLCKGKCIASECRWSWPTNGGAVWKAARSNCRCKNKDDGDDDDDDEEEEEENTPTPTTSKPTMTPTISLKPPTPAPVVDVPVETTGSPTTTTPTVSIMTPNPTTSTIVLPNPFLRSKTTSSDVVTDWNKILLSSVTTTSPPRASRAMGMVHVAMFEAINGIADEFKPYYMGFKPASGASAVAAAATAAHRTLSALFPTKLEVFDAQLALSLATIPMGTSRTSGVDWGTICADAILTLRANDNSTLQVPYIQPPDAGVWRPTPEPLAPALLPNWPLVQPFTLSSGSALRPPGVPALTSDEYTEAFNEVKAIGSRTSTVRTEDQEQVAFFWADGPGTETPPGHWLRIASDVMVARGLSTLDRARLFALLGMGVADAAIVSWDAKYGLNHWRPITGIREASTDGNPDTVEDVTWSPLINTPPFPAYTSGHSTFSATAATILKRLLGDNNSFSTTSQGLPNVTRSYASFSSAAAEAGMSRIYGGIHWQYDNVVALNSGDQLGNLVVDGFLNRIGDLNGDDCVNQVDADMLLAKFGTNDSAADLNQDGVVDAIDAGKFDNRFGNGCDGIFL